MLDKFWGRDLKKRLETTVKTQQKQMVALCERCVWEETPREVRSHSLSVITDHRGHWQGEHLSGLVRLADESHTRGRNLWA